jgi:ribonuclease-3
LIARYLQTKSQIDSARPILFPAMHVGSTMPGDPDLVRLSKLVGVEWNDSGLLEEAVCDESYVNENRASGAVNNYRLAFVGDAVLELVVRGEHFRSSPHASHGDLSISADEIVRNEILANTARSLGIGPMLGLGNGRIDEDCTRVLARAFEAILGAVFLDQGFAAAVVLAKRWLPVLDLADSLASGIKTI